MRLAYHPLIQRDVRGTLRYYDKISEPLGDEFWADLMRLLEVVADRPERFHMAGPELRRANMKRFPYHLLCRVSSGAIRVVAIRHNKRHPSFGSTRR